jgi:hypothetical protein
MCFAINDAGQITGSGTVGDQTHAFLPTPVTVAEVPEPETLALMGAGVIGLGLLRRRKDRDDTVRSLTGAWSSGTVRNPWYLRAFDFTPATWQPASQRHPHQKSSSIFQIGRTRNPVSYRDHSLKRIFQYTDINVRGLLEKIILKIDCRL